MLDVQESGSSKRIVKKQSNNDAHGYVISVYSIATCHYWLLVIETAYLHTGVGFGVARSNYSGDARASVRGTSNR